MYPSPTRLASLSVGAAFAAALTLGLAHAQSGLDVSLLTVGAMEAKLAERRQAFAQQRSQHENVAAQLVDSPDRRRALEQTLARDVRALYRLRRGGLLPIASGLDALMSHASRVRHFERLTQRTLGKLSAVRRGNAELEREASELSLQIAATEEELQTLEQALTRARDANAQAAVGIPPGNDVVSVSPPTIPGQLGAGLTFSDSKPEAGSSESSSERFSALRGQLEVPVVSPTSTEATTRPDGGGAALRFTGQSGSSVRAVAAGRVLQVERNEAYGLFVIVEHDPRYRTVYGNLGSAEVQPGDAISKSARIGVVGSAPIYFELRRGRRSLDARGWLQL